MSLLTCWAKVSLFSLLLPAGDWSPSSDENYAIHSSSEFCSSAPPVPPATLEITPGLALDLLLADPMKILLLVLFYAGT